MLGAVISPSNDYVLTPWLAKLPNRLHPWQLYTVTFSLYLYRHGLSSLPLPQWARRLFYKGNITTWLSSPFALRVTTHFIYHMVALSIQKKQNAKISLRNGQVFLITIYFEWWIKCSKWFASKSLMLRFFAVEINSVKLFKYNIWFLVKPVLLLSRCHFQKKTMLSLFRKFLCIRSVEKGKSNWSTWQKIFQWRGKFWLHPGCRGWLRYWHPNGWEQKY